MEALADAFVALVSAIAGVIARFAAAIYAQLWPRRRPSPLELADDTRRDAWRFLVLAPISIVILIAVVILAIRH
jgi:hypothetical protein